MSALPRKLWGLLSAHGGLPIGALLVLGLGVFPLTGPLPLQLLTLTQIFMLVALASSWNLIGGMTGYVDFGHCVFFGIGAYVMGVLVTPVTGKLLFAPNLSYWAALPLAGLVAAGFALLIGWPTLRLKGPYFSIAMLGTFMAVKELIRVGKPLTGGGEGLNLPPVLQREQDYYVMLGLMTLVVFCAGWIRRSQFGQSLIAIREDEVGAEMRGINTTRNKQAIFATSAFFTGMVGAVWAFQNTYIDVDVVFIEQRTVEMVMMAMLGGLGTVWGPPIGAVLLYTLKDALWEHYPQYHLLALGALLILVVLFLPEGIIGTLKDRSSTRLGRLLGRLLGDARPEAEA